MALKSGTGLIAKDGNKQAGRKIIDFEVLCHGTEHFWISTFITGRVEVQCSEARGEI